MILQWAAIADDQLITGQIEGDIPDNFRGLFQQARELACEVNPDAEMIEISYVEN